MHDYDRELAILYLRRDAHPEGSDEWKWWQEEIDLVLAERAMQ